MNSINSGGHKKSKISDVRKYSKDLEQGRLEIPARLTVGNKNKTVIIKEKLNPLVEEYRRINNNSK